MNEVIYYSYKTNKPCYFREDDEAIFTMDAVFFAYIEDHVWYDQKTNKPIAIEEKNIVHDYNTMAPLFYIERD